jgi:hypothetical protein
MLLARQKPRSLKIKKPEDFSPGFACFPDTTGEVVVTELSSFLLQIEYPY